jgi:hypothetical protein
MKIQNITFLTQAQKDTLIAANPNGSITSSVTRKMLEEVLKTGFVRTGYYNGSGKWATAQDFTDLVSGILTDLGINHEKGNDAPKGGVSGNFITIIK